MSDPKNKNNKQNHQKDFPQIYNYLMLLKMRGLMQKTNHYSQRNKGFCLDFYEDEQQPLNPFPTR